MRKANLILTTLALFALSASLNGQTYNSYQFIKPSTGISYDSTKYKSGHRYSAGESEEYQFNGADTGRKVMIFVKALPAVGNFGKDLRDKALNQMLENLGKSMKPNFTDSFEVISADKKIREIGEVGFIGMTMRIKFINAISTVLQGYYVGPNGMAEITFTSHDKNLEDAYTDIADFLKGFKSYSKEEMDKKNRGTSN
jgi:hypothetical protein